jgi:hypothetical protein
MTSQLDTATSRDIIARWLALAERRHAYLTLMFETGRWRRYYSERDFLADIQESKAGVEAWRALLTRKLSRDNKAADLSWLDRRRAALPLPGLWRDPVHVGTPAEIARDSGMQNSIARDGKTADAAEAPTVQARQVKVAEPVAGLTTVAQRYPLLHNVL